MDILISDITNSMTTFIEVLSILLIVVGVFATLYNLVRNTLFSPTPNAYAQSRLVLSRFLLLALEFQIAADILETVLKPSWEDFGKLAATIFVRSILSYILILETKSQT